MPILIKIAQNISTILRLRKGFEIAQFSYESTVRTKSVSITVLVGCHAQSLVSTVIDSTVT